MRSKTIVPPSGETSRFIHVPSSVVNETVLDGPSSMSTVQAGRSGVVSAAVAGAPIWAVAEKGMKAKTAAALKAAVSRDVRRMSGAPLGWVWSPKPRIEAAQFATPAHNETASRARPAAELRALAE